MRPTRQPWPDRVGLLDWIATRNGEPWLTDVSHNMDLPSPGLAKAQAALSRRDIGRDYAASSRSVMLDAVRVAIGREIEPHVMLKQG